MHEESRSKPTEKAGAEAPTTKHQDRSLHFGVNKTFPSPESLSSRPNFEQNPKRQKDGVREKERDYIRTYIHIIHTYNNNNNNNKRRQTTTSFYPEIWQAFRKAVRYNESYGIHANHVLEAFMLSYVERYARDRAQPKITQFFINKPGQVNIIQSSRKQCWRCQESFDDLIRVRYFSGLVKGSCAVCLEKDKERGLVKKVFGRSF